MKKRNMGMAALLFCMGLTACAGTAQTAETEQGTETSQEMETMEEVQTTETEEAVRLAKINDKIYADTGETSQALRCGVMDFSFTSSVEAGEPQENNQTNFGTGYEGQYGMRENRIEICIDDVWHIFAYQENDLEQLSASVEEVTANSLKWLVTNETDETFYYSNEYQLEIWEEEIQTWNYLVPANDAYGVEDVLNILPTGGENAQQIDWGNFYGTLEAGRYRIVKEVQDGGDESYHTLCTEFTIAP